MQDKVYDYIIVGQGLAGTAMALELLRRRKTILIYSDPGLHSSSKAAAGVFNPITGRRWVKTWRADEIFETFPAFYKETEKLTSHRFFFEVPIFRSFQTLKEQNDWLNKASNDRSLFVRQISAPGEFSGFINDPYGGVLMRKSGFLDVNLYLESMRNYFMATGVLREEQARLEGIRWQSPFLINGIKCARLLLCMGFEGTRQTPFGDSAFKTVKGELLEAESSVNLPNVIFNGPVFILPQEQGRIKIGATYDFEDKSLEPTTKARNSLLQKTGAYFLPEIRIINQIAGIRPSSADRRPVAGEHPEIPNLCILNGLGTKGVTLAPYIAKLLADSLENGKELDSEIDIKRFFN